MEAQLLGRQQSAARGQSLMRVVNEQIAEIVRERVPEGVLFQDFLCECSNPDCVTMVPLSLGEYDGVRRFPARFIVLSEHALADVEDVLETIRDGVVVVEKRGAAGEVAARLDPRSSNPAR